MYELCVQVRRRETEAEINLDGLRSSIRSTPVTSIYHISSYLLPSCGKVAEENQHGSCFILFPLSNVILFTFCSHFVPTSRLFALVAKPESSKNSSGLITSQSGSKQKMWKIALKMAGNVYSGRLFFFPNYLWTVDVPPNPNIEQPRQFLSL